MPNIMCIQLSPRYHCFCTWVNSTRNIWIYRSTMHIGNRTVSNRSQSTSSHQPLPASYPPSSPSHIWDAGNHFPHSKSPVTVRAFLQTRDARRLCVLALLCAGRQNGSDRHGSLSEEVHNGKKQENSKNECYSATLFLVKNNQSWSEEDRY